MGNPLERRLFIGEIDHTPNPDSEQAPLEPAELERLKVEHDIFPQAAERFEATIQANGYERVTELENGQPYPSVDKWLEGQFREHGRSSMYPCFVRDKESGEIFFCKTRIKLRKNWGGLRAEAEVLQHLPPDTPTPRLIQYIPEEEDTGQLEVLITEAIKFSEGSVQPLEQWTADQAHDATTQLKKLEGIPMQQLPTLPQEPAVTIQSVRDRSADITEPSVHHMFEEVIAEHAPHSDPVLIHGDLWLKNIIVGTNKTIFVDWERGGAGYRGQDIGRMWWSLWDSQETQQAVVETYLDEPDAALRSTRITQLKFGVVFEAMRWLADRAYLVKNPGYEELPTQVQEELQAIYDKAQAMLESVPAK